MLVITIIHHILTVFAQNKCNFLLHLNKTKQDRTFVRFKGADSQNQANNFIVFSVRVRLTNFWLWLLYIFSVHSWDWRDRSSNLKNKADEFLYFCYCCLIQRQQTTKNCVCESRTWFTLLLTVRWPPLSENYWKHITEAKNSHHHLQYET